MKRFLFSVVFLFLIGCTSENKNKVFEVSGATMGTRFLVKFTALSDFDPIPVEAKITKALKEVNRQMSTYEADSEITNFNQSRAKEWQKISPWFGETLFVSLDLAKKTSGAFDPTIGPLVNLWGFGPKKSKEVPSPEEIKATQKLVGFEKIQLKKENKMWLVKKDLASVYLDLSASAKGFGVDVLSNLLVEEGLGNHLVEIGGELRARGTKLGEPWVVAIEKPTKSGRSVQQIMALRDGALATSGNYRNYFESEGKTYPHTIDRKTGQAVQSELLSVSIIADECVRADALATALMVMGAEKAFKYAEGNDIAALLIVADKESDQAQTQVQMTTEFKKRGKPL